MTVAARPHWLALALLSPAGWSCCVAAGTRVRTPSGEVAAGALAVGNRVVSIDVASGRPVEGTIVHVRRAIRECVALRWRGGELVCTPDHPLYSPERGDYRPASDWVDGAARVLLARTGESLAEVAVEACERFAGVHEVVDLTLAGEPRNFVAAGIVVHNKTPNTELDLNVITADSPEFMLTASERSREFRLRLCDETHNPRNYASLVLEASASATPPGDDTAVRLTVDGVSVPSYVDVPVPGRSTLDLTDESFPDGTEFAGVTCDDGLVVVFERIDDATDGVVTVSWTATLTIRDLGDGFDLPTVTIDEE